MQTLAYEKFKCLDKDECYIFYFFIFFYVHTHHMEKIVLPSCARAALLYKTKSGDGILIAWLTLLN